MTDDAAGAFLVFRLRSFAWEMPENGLV